MIIEKDSTIVFRKASIQDCSQIETIENLTQISPWNKNKITQSLNGQDLVWVAEVDQIIVAHLFVMPVCENWELLNIAVHPEYQGKKIGSQALNFLLQKAKDNKISAIWLEVRESNQAALSLYKKFQFVQVGERKNYYPTEQGRENAILMQLDLF